MRTLTTPSRRAVALLAVALAGLAGGLLARLAGAAVLGDRILGLTVAAGLLPLAVSVARDLARREPGVDLIALLAMGGALALGEELAGAVIAVMLASGRLLEAHAGDRARRELSALLERAPRVVHRYENGALVSPPLEEVRPGDRLLVKPGEVVPVDGLVRGATAVLDESALTGEAELVERCDGDQVRSGVVNAGSPFDLRATTTAAGSTYAGILRLVEQAQGSKAPFVRLADRYALAFVPLTLAVAGAAWAAGAARPPTSATAASTSALTTRPPGPLPVTVARSMPRSWAMARAIGEAFTRASPPAGGVGGRVAAAGLSTSGAISIVAACSAGDGGAGLAGAAATAPAPAPMIAIGWPIGTVSPSWTRICCSTPSSKASSSMVALSVSISASRSPRCT